MTLHSVPNTNKEKITMENKMKVLAAMVGFHKEDLSLARQLELEAVKEKINKPIEWILIALSKDKIDAWEKWGFRLMEKPEFQKEIDVIYEKFQKIKDEDIRKELKRIDKKGGPQIWVSDKSLERVYQTLQRDWDLNVSLTAAGQVRVREIANKVRSLEDIYALPQEDQLILTSGIIRIN